MSQRKQFRLSPEIDKTFDNKMGNALQVIDKLEDPSISVVALVRLLEGKAGLLGQIAIAYNDKFEAPDFYSQIKELSDKKYIPEKIQLSLNSLRKHQNLIKHSNESIANYSVDDALRIREEVLSILEWFYCECEKGPKLKSISQPLMIITAQVGHRRTILGQAEIDDRGNVEVKKMKVIESAEFFRERGFDLLRCALSIFTNGSKPEGYVISLASPVDRDGRRLESHGWQYWPTDVISALDLKKPTVVLNDALAFSFVVDVKTINEPILILTLGSGIGCSILKYNNGLPVVRPIELGEKKYTIENVTGPVHELLGWKYFEDIHKDNSYHYGKIMSTFTGRVAEFIKILSKENTFNSIIIGGGRSVFLSQDTLRRYLNPPNMPFQVLSDDEHIIRASAQAWRYKIQENHNLIDTL